MGLMRVEKTKTPKFVLEPVSEWQTLPTAEQLEVMKALANPDRHQIFRELERGPMRLSELARRMGRRLGKGYPPTLLRHHLEYLQRAGLISYEADPGSKRVKFIHRVADVQVQVRSRPRAPALERVPEEEFEEGLKEALRGGG